MAEKIKVTVLESDEAAERRLFAEGDAILKEGETTLFGMELPMQMIHQIQDDSQKDCKSLMETFKKRKQEKEIPRWRRFFQFA